MPRVSVIFHGQCGGFGADPHAAGCARFMRIKDAECKGPIVAGRVRGKSIERRLKKQRLSLGFLRKCARPATCLVIKWKNFI